MRHLKWIFRVVVILIATIFAFINMQSVTVHLDPLGLEFEALAAVEMPLAFVIIASVALGLIIGVLWMWGAYRPTSRALRAERRTVRQLERENERAIQALKTSDHPDSVGPPARRA